jgi:hypothetical protein
MRCARYITHRGEMRNAYKILVGTSEGNTTWETYVFTGVNIKRNLKYGLRTWAGFNWLRIESTGGLL